LWRYKKLTNENVKEEKVIEKHSDDEDYNSCFKLKRNLKNSCRKIMMKHQTAKKMTVDDFASVATEEEKFITRLREQQKDKRGADENRKTFHKCLNKYFSKHHRTHQLLNEVHEEKLQDVYVASGIYDKFGSSCTESLGSHDQAKPEIEAEDLSAASWYHSGIVGNFSVEILEHQNPGSFIIHKASSKSGNFILSLRVPSQSTKVVHHLIVRSKRGYRLKGATKFFTTITSLVTHHSVMAEQLPVALLLQRPYNTVKKSDDNDDFYSIEDLGTIFTDLEL